MHSYPWMYLEMNGQPDASPILPLVLIRNGAWWSPEPIWIPWQKMKTKLLVAYKKYKGKVVPVLFA